MHRFVYRAFLSSILGLSLIASACGSSGGGSPSASKGTIKIGAFGFSESAILAQIYGGALKKDGYTVTYKLNLGARSVVAPALQRGDIDLYPGYTASDLEFFNHNAGQAGTDASVNAQKLNAVLSPMGLKALTPSPATDQNAFAVTKDTASKNNLKSLADLAPVAGQFILGGPPDCPNRNDCQAGLAKTYNVHFKDFKPLDFGGPLTIAALDNGSIQVALVFSSDGTVAAKGFTVLADPMHMVNADAVVPIGRTQALSGDAPGVLDKVSAKLTTADLLEMNKKADVDKQDPADVAAAWLSSHGY